MSDLEFQNLSLLQAELSKKVILPNENEEMYVPKQGNIVLTLDIQYVEEKAFVAGDWQFIGGNHIFTKVAICDVIFPYYPAFFCFREGPPLLEFLEKSYTAQIPKPDVILVDGHGQAHPRKFGVASWLGVHSHLPCVGCAKDSLVWYEKDKLYIEKDSVLGISLGLDLIGYAFRSQTNVKPIFVSNAHKISLIQSVELVKGLVGEYRIPEPLRRADFACREASKNNPKNGWDWL